MPQNTVCYIDDITIPHAWWNCELTNNKLYMMVNGNYYITYLQTQNHNGITLKDTLNYIFTNQLANNGLSATYNISTNDLTISTTSNTVNFQILTDDEILAGTWTNPSLDRNNLWSCNELIGNVGISSGYYTKDNPYKISFLNFASLRNVYITSGCLGSLSATIGPRGTLCNIVKKCPVTADFGYNIVDSQSVAHDYIDVSKSTLKCLDFILRLFGEI